MAAIDEVQYGELLRDARPRVPETDEENARLVGILEALDDLPELSPAQESLAEIWLCW